MKVAFLFVPQWTAAHPHYSMSLLAGQLRHANHQVDLFDLNLEFLDYALQPGTAHFSYQRSVMEKRFALTEARLRLAVQDESLPAKVAAKKHEVINAYLDGFSEDDQTYERWGKAADELRSHDSFYDPTRFVAAMASIDEALRHYSLPYFPNEVAWNDFAHPTVSFNLGPMVEMCRDSLTNPFYAFLQEQVEPILNSGADNLAISISAFSQVIPGLTLALMLKERRDRCDLPIHISLGGNFFSRLKKQLIDNPLFFMLFCDSVVIGEGEVPCVELADALADNPRDKKRLSRVSSLLYLDDETGRVADTPESKPKAIEDLAFMDLGGFPLERYHAPDTVLSIRASKGCYYGKCLFCDSHFGLRDARMSVDRLIEEMRWLRREYGARHFEFVDQCIEPDYMRAMCEGFIKADLGVRWFCNGRTESGFAPELLQLMQRAGATKIMWGVESGSDRLLKLMKKGVSVTTRLEILRASSDAGLWNFAYIFFGFPTETEAEALSTVELIADNTDIIHSYGRSTFTLGKHSPMMAELKGLGIDDYTEDDQEFSTNLTFTAPDSLTGTRLMEVESQCTAIARQAYQDPLWMVLRSRETLHLYLAEHGSDYVKGYELETGSDSETENFVF